MKINEEMFIQPVVITEEHNCQKNTRRKIVERCRPARNKQDAKCGETDDVAEISNSKENGTVLFTSLYMIFAYGQTKRHSETAKHCNFQIIGGRATATLAFNTFAFLCE